MSDGPDFTMTYPCHFLIGADGGYAWHYIDGNKCLCVFTSHSTIRDFALFILREQHGPDYDKVTNIPGTMCRDHEELTRVLQSSESELAGSGISHISIDPQPVGTSKYTTIREFIAQLPHERPRMDDQRTDREGGGMKGSLRYVILVVMIMATFDRGYQAIFEHHMVSAVAAAVFGLISIYIMWRLHSETISNPLPAPPTWLLVMLILFIVARIARISGYPSVASFFSFAGFMVPAFLYVTGQCKNSTPTT